MGMRVGSFVWLVSTQIILTLYATFDEDVHGAVIKLLN